MREKAAEFFRTAAKPYPLITVARVNISSDQQYAEIMVTVYPETEETTTVEFLQRKRGELNDHLKKHTRLGSIPFMKIAVDQQEKKRQRIDHLTKNL